MNGINCDPRNAANMLPHSELDAMPVIRFVYQVALGTGSTDLDAAAQVYEPLIRRRAALGLKTIAVFGHQFRGEGAGGYPAWEDMTLVHWERLISEFSNMFLPTVLRYSGLGLWYQIWNEQDQASMSAVGVPADVYGALLKECYRIVEAHDSSGRIVTGGVVSGTVSGRKYLEDANAAAHCHYAAFHPYGADANGIGGVPPIPTLQAHIAYFSALGVPLLISEYGILGGGVPNGTLAQYIENVQSIAGTALPVCFFTVQTGVGGANGLRDLTGAVKPDVWAALTDRAAPPVEPPDDGTGNKVPRRVVGMAGYLNVRSGPGLSFETVDRLVNGSLIGLTNKPVVSADGHEWVNIKYNGRNVWAARTAPVTGGGLKVEV